MLQGSIQRDTWELKTPINAVTATTESEEIVIAGAKKITLFFTRANHTSGSTLFDVDVSLDGTTYVDFAQLITNVINGITEGKVRVASVSLSSNTTSAVSMDLDNSAFYSMKVKATETTDGTHTVKVLIEY